MLRRGRLSPHALGLRRWRVLSLYSVHATDLPVAGLLDVALFDDGRQQECRGPQLVSDALATT